MTRTRSVAVPEVTADELAADLAVAPLARAETIPSRWYTDPRFHAFEREAVFARSWQSVGHAAQVAEAGEYLTATVAGEPVLVVRGHDGVLRAFFNVCRHRGGPLATDERGRVKQVLQCKYHGWCYLPDGTLRGVPRFDHTELFDKRDFGLVPVELGEWHGLLFVRLAPGPVELPALLAGIAERVAPVDLAALAFDRRVVYDVACNWKVYVDNYLEGYHIPLVHPELCRVLDVRAYLTETHDWHSLQHSPLRPGDAGPYGGDGDAFYWFVFPNFMLNVLPGRVQTNLVVPVDAGRCRVVFDYYHATAGGASVSPEARERMERDVEFSDRVQAEDGEICEHVQRGLASRAYDRGRFSVECEAGVHHFQTLLKRVYGDAAGPARK